MVQRTNIFVENQYDFNSGAAHRAINPSGMYFQKNQTDILLYIQFHF